jgi:hypothetical protein
MATKIVLLMMRQDGDKNCFANNATRWRQKTVLLTMQQDSDKNGFANDATRRRQKLFC